MHRAGFKIETFRIARPRALRNARNPLRERGFAGARGDEEKARAGVGDRLRALGREASVWGRPPGRDTHAP